MLTGEVVWGVANVCEGVCLVCSQGSACICMCVYGHVCVSTVYMCVRAVRTCVCSYVRVCMRACVCVRVAMRASTTYGPLTHPTVLALVSAAVWNPDVSPSAKDVSTPPASSPASSPRSTARGTTDCKYASSNRLWTEHRAIWWHPCNRMDGNQSYKIRQAPRARKWRETRKETREGKGKGEHTVHIAIKPPGMLCGLRLGSMAQSNGKWG